MISQFTGFIYRNLIKPILFLFPADDVHGWFLNSGRWLGQHRFFKTFWKMWSYGDSILNQNLAGLVFKIPSVYQPDLITMDLVEILPSIGFGLIPLALSLLSHIPAIRTDVGAVAKI